MNKSVVKGWTAALIAGAFAFLASPASAEIVSTEQVQVQSDRERVREFMSRQGAEERLKALGVAPEDAKKRVDALTDEEIRVIAGKLDTLPAGGALDKTDWVIILLLVLVLVLVL